MWKFVIFAFLDNSGFALSVTIVALEMRRKNVFGTKKYGLAKTSGEKKFSS